MLKVVDPRYLKSNLPGFSKDGEHQTSKFVSKYPGYEKMNEEWEKIKKAAAK